MVKQFLTGLLVVIFGNTASAQTCPPNIDFEQGDWSNWQLFAGTVQDVGAVRQFTLNSTAPLPNRHTIFPVQPPSVVDPYGGFPMSCQNGSAYSIRLGFPSEPSPSRNCERISYQFSIPAGSTSYSLTYQYAVVFENPVGHQPYQQPQFEAKIYDVTTGNYINCASFSFYATANLPGFSLSPMLSNHGESVWYKPWTPVTVNLTGYAGHTLILEFTNADCTLSGHWAYSYIDVNTGCASPIAGAEFCPGSTSVDVVAPHGYQSYTWWNNGFTQQITTNQTMTLTPPPTSPTIYAVDVVPYPGFGCRDTIYATVKPLPTVPVDAGLDRIICPGVATPPAPLGAPAQAGYTYSWAPATGLSNANIAQPVPTPSATTQYILTMTDVATNCTAEDTVIVTVAPAMSGAFTINNPNQCLDGNNYVFTSNASNPAGTTYEWYFGDDPNGVVQSTQPNPTYQYTAAGSYEVKLVVTSPSGCQDSSKQTVVISASPVADAGPDQLLCGGTTSSVQIGTPAVAGNTYSWSPATGLSNPNAAQPTASPSSTTIYTVTVTGPGGCVTTDDVEVAVAPSISAAFTINNANQCLDGNNYQFTSSPSNPAGINYSWNFGHDGDPTAVHSTQANPTFQYPAAGSFTVTLTVASAAGTCQQTSQQTVVLSPSPVADAGPDHLLCGGTGASAQLGVAPVAGYTYSWSPATGLSNPNVAQPMASPTTTTVYTLSVTGQGGCVTTDDVTVTVTQNLNATFNVNNQIQCITGNNFQFTLANPGAGLNYAWNFGDDGDPTAVHSTQQNPSHSFATAGTYTVTATISTAGGCQASSTMDVTVTPVPTGTITSTETNICEGTPVVLTANGAANTYKWYLNGAVQGTTTTNTYNATQPGTYTVEFDNGCVNMATGSVTLTITRKPNVDFTFTTKCLGFPTPFTDASTVSNSLPVNYSWDFGTTEVPGSTQPSPTITYPSAGNYSVVLTVTPQACPALATTKEKEVEIKGPEANIRYPDAAAMENTPTQISARNIGTTYAWSPGTNITSTSTMQTTFQGTADQEYTITITDSRECVTVDTLMVRVYKEVNIYMPKAFTPNNDGLNDYMFPYLIGIKELKVFRIINRWGVIVFESRNALPGWDGKYKGTAQPMDGYVWEIQAIDYFGRTHNRSGSFTLIR